MWVFFGISLITGIVIINVHGIVALSIIHKAASAALFIILLTILFVTKLCGKKVRVYSKLFFLTIFGGTK